jgi:hypothetical protein
MSDFEIGEQVLGLAAILTGPVNVLFDFVDHVPVSCGSATCAETRETPRSVRSGIDIGESMAVRSAERGVIDRGQEKSGGLQPVFDGSIPSRLCGGLL